MQLRQIRYPYPPDAADYRTPEAGMTFLGLRMQECVRSTTPQSEITSDYLSSQAADWFTVTPSGEQIAGGGASWNDWPRPKFPEAVTFDSPGQCFKGWIVVSVPNGTKVTKMVYRPGGETVAEWLP